MQLRGRDLALSATDLSNFLSCRHRTALDMAAAYGKRRRPFHHDPLLELLMQRGLAHERAYVEALTAERGAAVDLTSVDDRDALIDRTVDAMRQGVPLIVQGGLADGPWFGKPDILQRVDRPSALGAWSYEVVDTKLARDTRAGTMLQLGLYSDMLAGAQGTRPEWFSVVTPNDDDPVERYRVDDYAAYFRLVRAQMLAAIAEGDAELAERNYPDPVDHCDICPWIGECAARRRADDHLSLVAGITRVQRRELEAHAVATLTSLADLALPLPFKPRRGSIETYTRVRDQARLQRESRGRTPPVHELLAVEPEHGLCRLPEPTPGDLFLDLEGDLFAGEERGGREYLFGVVQADGSYTAHWAFTDADERRAFERVIDTIVAAARAHPGMHVYHYAAYEPAAFKRLMGRYATRERELDAMLRAGRFVDLYAVVRQGLRAGVEKYSIKNLEPLYGFVRNVDLAEANRNLTAMEYALERGMPDVLPETVRATVEGYNRDDCQSTLRLRDWLESIRATLIAEGTEVPRPTLADEEPPAEVDERAQRVDALRARLLAGIPDDPVARTAEQRGRWLLAYMLDYHRREDKATWWEFFRLADLPEEELLDEREGIAGLELVERVGPAMGKTGTTRSVIDRYRYPAQEMELDVGATLKLQGRADFGQIVALDRVHRTLDVRKGPARAELHPTAVFRFDYVSSDAMERSLERIGEAVADGIDGFDAARALLAADPPRLARDAFAQRAGETEVDFAVRAAGDMRGSVLAVQGPPGAGKTYCGARMICELVASGRKVGVAATSHKVIRNLLDAVARAAAERGIDARLAHKDGGSESEAGPIRSLDGNDGAIAALHSGDANVVGGTAWLWARPEFAGAVDVLVVDEAGQMSLANVVAISPAADSVVLLGDPQQLEQPRKGSHPIGVDVSALEHMLAGEQTIAADRGIFLPVTRRLAPAVCAFTSEIFYERRLHSLDGLERQTLTGVAGLPSAGLAVVDVVHDGNRNYAPEEIDTVAELVSRFTAGGSWIDEHGDTRVLEGTDVLVVAPYNAQVTRLAERLAGTDARVGTVDKFQGQEAPIVIYSMAASRPEDAPRGLEFLFSLNRLNVATSRARCLAVVVASPRLYEPECRSPRQMKLANALCRFREMATQVRL